MISIGDIWLIHKFLTGEAEPKPYFVKLPFLLLLMVLWQGSCCVDLAVLEVIYGPGDPQTCCTPPTSAFWVLRTQMWVITPSLMQIVKLVRWVTANAFRKAPKCMCSLRNSYKMIPHICCVIQAQNVSDYSGESPSTPILSSPSL